MKLPFGMFRDTDIEDVPDSYITWLLETDWFDKKFPQLVKPLDEELKYRQKWGYKINRAGDKEEIKERSAWEVSNDE